MRDKPVLNSFVYAKIFDIARYKAVAVQELFDPLMEEVTIFFLDQIKDTNDKESASRAIEIIGSIVSTLFPTNFQKYLFDTLEYSLPHLVMRKCRELLDFISSSLGESVSVLCCREIQNILL